MGKGGAGYSAHKKLYCSRKSLNDSDLDDIERWFNASRDYEEVDFSYNCISAAGLRKLLQACKGCYCLRVLKLFKNYIDDQGAEHLADFITESRSIEEIHLSHNNLTGAGVFLLVAAADKVRTDREAPLWLRVEQNYVADPDKVFWDMEKQVSVCSREDEKACTARVCCRRKKVHLPHFRLQREKGEKGYAKGSSRHAGVNGSADRDAEEQRREASSGCRVVLIARPKSPSLEDRARSRSRPGNHTGHRAGSARHAPTDICADRSCRGERVSRRDRIRRSERGEGVIRMRRRDAIVRHRRLVHGDDGHGRCRREDRCRRERTRHRHLGERSHERRRRRVYGEGNIEAPLRRRKRRRMDADPVGAGRRVEVAVESAPRTTEGARPKAMPKPAPLPLPVVEEGSVSIPGSYSDESEYEEVEASPGQGVAAASRRPGKASKQLADPRTEQPGAIPLPLSPEEAGGACSSEGAEPPTEAEEEGSSAEASNSEPAAAEQGDARWEEDRGCPPPSVSPSKSLSRKGGVIGGCGRKKRQQAPGAGDAPPSSRVQERMRTLKEQLAKRMKPTRFDAKAVSQSAELELDVDEL